MHDLWRLRLQLRQRGRPVGAGESHPVRDRSLLQHRSAHPLWDVVRGSDRDRLAALHLEANPTATPAAVLNALRLNAANLGDIDGNLTVDYLVRSPVATPACNVPQRLFTNGATATSAATAVKFTTIDLADSCPSGTTASSPTMPAHGQLSIAGIAPEGVLYLYTPSGTYTGPDAFNYTITPSTHGTGTVKVIVQPPVN